jgi:hypothetical protein
VHVKIDSDACNDTAGGKAYNVAGFASPVSANLAFCPTVDGPHRIDVELHKDDHSLVTDAASEAVSAWVNISAATQAPPAPEPGPEAAALVITSPAPNGQLTMGADQRVPIAFTVSGFTLAMPGTCPAGDTKCGHVHLKIDGAACNDVAGGKAYNNAGFASPIWGNLSFCPTAAGSHNALLELHNDDHTAHMNQGAPVTAMVRFVASTY